jgi:pyruvate dehydrogenase E2 component (dihydrolipoamide acetyltransferase)
MSTEVKLPELGENIESGTVVKLLVTVGQKIEQDQPVMELETDKATIEVPSPNAGTVKEIRVQEGGKAEVGQTVMVLEDGTSAETKQQPSKKKTPAKAKEPKAEAKPEEPKQKEEIPDEADLEAARSEGVKDASLLTEKPKKQEKARQEEPVEKEQEELESEAAEAGIEVQDAEVIHPKGTAVAAPSQVVAASPSVRRTAREIGIDIADVPGSGPGGRITVEDVKEFARQIHRGGSRPAAGGPVATPPLPDFSRWGAIERKPMSNIREKTAERMAIAWSNVPTVTQYDQADISRVEEYRKNFGAKAEAAGGKLTVTAVLLKVIASALKNFPEFNASIDISKKEIIYKKYFHIGIAVDTDRGLLVPVIRDVDRKNILQLSVELTEVAEKARNRKLSLEEMQGGGFTITNLGGIGGTNFSPIVNYPEVAILGISRSSVQPVYVDGKFEPRTMLPLSLSYDHRIIDGADAARFLRWVCEAIRDPFLVALEG